MIDPIEKRRALTRDEIQKLMDVAPRQRYLLYVVALSTGLRANEIKSLSVADLNYDMRGLNLHAEWTKNRKPGIQELADWIFKLLEKLAQDKDLDATLLYVPSHAARELDKDLESSRNSQMDS